MPPPGDAARAVQCRNDADGQADERGQAQGERECHAYRLRWHPPRGNSGGLSAITASTATIGQDDPEPAAERSKHQRLGEQLADQPQPGRAQGAAHREFRVALDAARQQQVRHVHARDREQQNDRAQDGEQCRPDGPREIVLQRLAR